MSEREIVSALFDFVCRSIERTPAFSPASFIYDQRSGSFEFHQGPVFANIVLADEINRASPKTQAALLEVMEEGHVMEIIAAEEPVEIHAIFSDRFGGQHTWTYKKQEPGEYVIHIRKEGAQAEAEDAVVLVNTFDVRPFHPAKRHDKFFQAFDELKPGEAFIFTNDHDPKPLYYQIEAESKEPFNWEYLQSGPEVWEVKVMKTKA